MKTDPAPQTDFSQLLARAALLLLGSSALGYLAPDVAAFGLVSVAVLAGIFWRYVGWHAILVFAGGLVGLAARHSAGSPERFRSNLIGMVAIAIMMVGLGVVARGIGGSRRSGRR